MSWRGTLACLFLALTLTGCFSSRAPRSPAPPPAVEPPAPAPEPAPAPAPEPRAPKPDPDAVPPGAAELTLGEGLKLRVLPNWGTMPDVKRPAQLLHRGPEEWELINAVNVPNIPGEAVTFRREDLPGYPGAIVIEARRAGGVRHGAVAVVGGRLVALHYHWLIAPQPEITTGAFLFLNKYLNQLWVYRDGALVATYPTANGRDPWGTQPTWEDYKKNYKTPEGLFPIKQKIVNPPYNNLGGNLKPVAGGAPDNPLGTRWMGFEALPGDGGGVWGFHGTYVPAQLGTWASEGCVRLATPDAEAVFDMVEIGTMVRIVSGR